MSTVPLPVICNRVRSQISLELDGELSQLERAMLRVHLESCGECQAYQAEVTGFTRVLREAPLEHMERPVVVRKPRRVIAARLQAGAAAAMAIVALGVASRIALVEPSSPPSPAAGEELFPTLRELQDELAILEMVRPGKPLGHAHIGYVI